MEYVAHSEEETQAIARTCAEQAVPGDVYLLSGPLGAGKSVFARAFIRALTRIPDLDVPSPTFTLVQTYDAPAGTLWHFDLYRIESPEEIYELGWEEALAGGILLLEWPERLAGRVPAHSTQIAFETVPGEPEKRIIKTGVCP